MSWYKESKVSQEANEEFEKETEWIPVDSSFITEVAYHDAAEVFEIKIKSKGDTVRKYTFIGVPKKAFDKFMAAESKGRAFQEIKKNYSLTQS